MPKVLKSPNNFLIFLIASCALILLSFFFLNSYIYNEKQAKNPMENIERYQGELTGEYVCLPHANANGPTTLECAYGLKTDAGEYYAVDLQIDNTGVPEFIAGQKVTLSGMITPIEMISTDYWQKYNIRGILSVTSQIDPAPQVDESGEVFCTMDAMECPDGSFVGRIPPSCNFAPCPGN